MCHANKIVCSLWAEVSYETGSCSYTVTTVGGSRPLKFMDTLKKKKTHLALFGCLGTVLKY